MSFHLGIPDSNDIQSVLEISPDGSWIEGFRKAKEGCHDTGTWKGFYADSSIRSVGQYIDGFQEGIWIFYHQNGNVEQEGNYLKGRQVGIWKNYYDNKALYSKLIFENESNSFKVVYFHKNGQLNFKILYKNQKPYSILASFDKDGNERSMGSLEEGTGTYLIYEENKVVETYYYENGDLIKIKKNK
ncbi:MAG: hypothetical protein GY827_09510 [Cytophagales bacterium]|nr:hypothetical protein [Cytophagales bacterium]